MAVDRSETGSRLALPVLFALLVALVGCSSPLPAGPGATAAAHRVEYDRSSVTGAERPS